MTAVNPLLILRLGSHAEKDYFDKVIRFIDGYIVAANLVESTPAATASLVFRFSGRKRHVPYLLDPMTYAFGAYFDPESGSVRHDLDWIKSDQKRQGGIAREFKRSYKNLGEALGGPFADAVLDPRNAKSAISPSDISDPAMIDEVCQSVAEYQLSRIPYIFSEEMSEDPAASRIADSFPRPQAVIAPYFYVEPTNEEEWLEVNLALMRGTSMVNMGLPVHGVLCMDESFLLDSNKVRRIVDAISATGVNGIWLWISRLNEDELTGAGQNAIFRRDIYTKLSSLKWIVESLSKSMEVYNMHGGYFSLALSKYGMKGISHGVGYGEQKDVVPVVGQALPIVRYYLPPLRRRLGVPDIERCFHSLGIVEPQEFYDQICDCAICKGVVTNNVNQFRLFGEMQPPKLGRQRGSQTPAAAKRCRFHFLLTRIRERDWIKGASLLDVVNSLRDANTSWKSQPAVQRYCPHLEVWASVLSGSVHSA